MAQLCSKCGHEVTPGQQFCGSCGAPAAVSVAPVPYAQPAMAPPPAPSGGNTAVKIILIVVLVIVGLGVLGLGAVGYTVYRVKKAIHLNDHNGQMTFHTSEGDISANTKESFSVSDLGTDPYPGAEVVKGGMRMNTPQGSLAITVFASSDAKEQVLAYYKNKFGASASTMDTPGAAIVTQKKGEHESVMVTITSGDSQHPGKTMISITHSIEK